jgi:hypothetical protein
VPSAARSRTVAFAARRRDPTQDGERDRDGANFTELAPHRQALLAKRTGAGEVALEQSQAAQADEQGRAGGQREVGFGQADLEPVARSDEAVVSSDS